MPDWANWKDQAWGTSAEPIVMVYNRGLIADAAVPRTHVELRRFLENTGGRRAGQIATSDPVTSAVAYLYLTQDQQATHDIWRLVRAMGDNKVQLFTSAEEVLGAVKSGRAAIGYNIVGSYALGEVESDASLGMMLPNDYTLLMSRIAIIPAAAAHPSAAKLFLDFLLSRRGQTHLAQVDMPSVRSDVANPPALRPPGVPLRAIRVGPSLLVSQDALTRRYFLKRWKAAVDRR
ncbi:MAG: ABC transporter substrate-binding protein [Proteobacteria bacterium]|nr:ABC transporter substrate-binding protein [Pseudomonadota bacterium]